MEPPKFFEHYRVIGDPIDRTGPALNYKATNTRTDETVLLQVIPLADVDQNKRLQFEERVRLLQQVDHVNVARVLGVESDEGHLGLISEFVEGETAQTWIADHGPMAADAVLRIGLQVVRALGAAAFFGLSHRAIEPSNIVILRGELAEGGWPLIKLKNFGLAGLAVYDQPGVASESLAHAPSAFASPEQLLDKPIDFRSEIYSLGATMSYLLTGVAPVAVNGMKARLRTRRLPELRRAPSSLRNLLVHMLRENPENRPQDPVAFEAELRECLGRVERRQALGRRLGIPPATVVPRASKRPLARSTSPIPPPLPGIAEPELKRAPSITAQIIRGVVAFAALILVGGIVAAFFLPEDVLPFHKDTAEKIGVPIGVASPAEVTTVSAPAATPSATAVAANDVSTPAPITAATPTPEIVAQTSPPPAETPVESSSNTDAVAANSPNESAPSESNDEEAPAPKKVARSTSTRRSVAPPSENAPKTNGVHARLLGTTRDGRRILRLPSGRIVAVRPGRPDQDVDLNGRARHRTYLPRDPDAPYQPFDRN